MEWCLGGETLGLNEEFLLTHGDIKDADRSNLGPDTKTKAYIVVTFLAILEMAKKGELLISQDKKTKEITCEAI